MRGLPPIPNEVALLELTYDVDGRPASTWHWIYHPDLQVFTLADMATYWGELVFATLGSVTSLMANAGSVVRVALRRFGEQPLEYVDAPAPNHGANGSCQVLLAAAGVYWTTPYAGRGGRAYTRWPAFPDAWTDDHVSLNGLGFAEIGHWSKLFLAEVNGVTVGTFGPGTLVSLHRASGGVPLDRAEPRAIVGAVPIRRVAAIVRRARI